MVVSMYCELFALRFCKITLFSFAQDESCIAGLVATLVATEAWSSFLRDFGEMAFFQFFRYILFLLNLTMKVK